MSSIDTLMTTDEVADLVEGRHGNEPLLAWTVMMAVDECSRRVAARLAAAEARVAALEGALRSLRDNAETMDVWAVIDAAAAALDAGDAGGASGQGRDGE